MTDARHTNGILQRLVAIKQNAREASLAALQARLRAAEARLAALEAQALAGWDVDPLDRARAALHAAWARQAAEAVDTERSDLEAQVAAEREALGRLIAGGEVLRRSA